MSLKMDEEHNTTYNDNSEEESNAKILSLQSQNEQILYNATLMTEMALDIKDKCTTSEKHVTNLRNFAIRACKTVSNIHNTSKAYLLLAQKLILSAMKVLESLQSNDQKLVLIKFEFEKLLTILERELSDFEDTDTVDMNQNLGDINLKTISEKIRNLEERQKWNDSYLHSSNSNRSFKSDVDEKYPDKLTKDAIMDLDNVVNLPSVPEDIFTTFSRPKRTSSLSSLKNLRKVKLFLQRAENSSDDDEDWEEANSSSSKLGIGDSEDLERRNSCLKNTSLLQDIQEEM